MHAIVHNLKHIFLTSDIKKNLYLSLLSEHGSAELIEETTNLNSDVLTSSENVTETKEPSEEENTENMLVDKETEEEATKSVDDEETSQHKSKSVSFDNTNNSKSSSEKISETKSIELSTKPILSKKSVDVNDIISTGEDLSAKDSVLNVKAAESSTDSVFGLGESVTVERFVRDDLNGSTVTYSTGEIRKGVFGHQSYEKIERDSSDRIVKAAETVHQLGTVENESSVLLPAVKSSSDNFSVQDSRSFLVIEEFWQEVPGIGPVIPEPQILAVVEYMHYWASKQEGMVMPRNINHILCPPLDSLPTNDEDAEPRY